MHYLKLMDQDRKGAWGIPWHLKSMKDACDCDKLRGAV